MIKTFEPPFLLNAEHSFIEDKIKLYSSNLFKNKLYGYTIALFFNLYLINCILKNHSLITIIFEILLFYILENIILPNIFNNKIK